MRSHPVICTLALSLLLPSLCLAGVKEDLQGVKKEIQEKNLLLSKTRKVETKVSGELEQIQRSLKEKQSHLVQLGHDLAGVEKGIGQTLGEIERTRLEAEKKRAQIDRRIAALYKGGGDRQPEGDLLLRVVSPDERKPALHEERAGERQETVLPV